MVRIFTRGLLVILALWSLPGCTICQNPDDGTYGYYGGPWNASGGNWGRVGSVLDTRNAESVEQSWEYDTPAESEENMGSRLETSASIGD